MRSNGGLYFLTLLAMLAQSHAALGSVSDGDYGVDPPLFSSDDLSGFNFFTDPDIVGDNSAIGDLSTNDDTTPLFADNIDDCSSNDALQPSSKIRARDNQLCPSGLGSNNPAVRIPNVDDLDNLVNPNPDSSKPEKVWHKGLGYYSICPSRSKKPADWVVCGIQGGSHGQATWEFDVYDAELCELLIYFKPSLCVYYSYTNSEKGTNLLSSMIPSRFFRRYKM